MHVGTGVPVVGKPLQDSANGLLNPLGEMENTVKVIDCNGKGKTSLTIRLIGIAETLDDGHGGGRQADDEILDRLLQRG